jgi:hypothetical protein
LKNRLERFHKEGSEKINGANAEIQMLRKKILLMEQRDLAAKAAQKSFEAGETGYAVTRKLREIQKRLEAGRDGKHEKDAGDVSHHTVAQF